MVADAGPGAAPRRASPHRSPDPARARALFLHPITPLRAPLSPPAPPRAHKKQVYYVAKQIAHPCSPEAFGLALAAHFLAHHPLVSRAKVRVTASPWARHTPAGGGGAPHAHGFEGGGGGDRFAVVLQGRQAGDGGGGGPAPPTVIAGVAGWRVLKTTQSGYAGFARDAWTALPDAADRILATAVSASWRYSCSAGPPPDYDAAYGAVTAAMAASFFGPPREGVFSPSAQFTLHAMARAALAAAPAVDSITLTLPNLHFLPCAPLGDARGFQNDVYTATSEPHGVIEAVLVRGGEQGKAPVRPHVELWGEDGLGPAARL